MIAFSPFHANIERLIYLMRKTVLLSLWYFSFIIYKTLVLTSLKWARLLREPITEVLRLETCQSLQRNSSQSAERWGPCYISFCLLARSNAPPPKHKQVDVMISDVRSSVVCMGRAQRTQKFAA